MRMRWIASLVSLSLASGHGVRAQEALWFTPSQPAVVAPETPAEELSFSQRFGGLLSQPGHQTQPVTRPAVRGAQVAPLAPQVKPNYVQAPAHTKSPNPSAEKPPTSPTKSLGVVDRIPWQTHVTRPTLASAPPTLTVAPPTLKVAQKSSPAAPVASSTHLPAEPILAPPAVAVVDHPPQLPKNAAKVQSAARGPARASILPHAPTPVTTAVAHKPAPQEPAPEEPAPQAQSPNRSELDRLLADSLIQPVPPEKLSPALLALPPQAEHPPAVVSAPKKTAAKTAAKTAVHPVVQSVAEPTMEPVDKPRRVASQLTSAPVSPQYTFVDDQTSASDRAPASVVPAPAVTNRLTDKFEYASPLQQVAQTPAPANLPPPETDGLLSTQAMIGPLQGAERLFGRLNIREDLRDVADRIESGPRGDTGNFEWMPAAYTWISPAFYHYPLYFEQPNLERYGLGPRPVLKPLASSIHFFGSIPLVPYKTLTHHPRERVYTLGNMRPGNCVPVQRGVILGPSKVGEVTMFWEECSGY